MFSMLSKFIRDDSGVTAIEYALIAALIAVVIISALKLIGDNLNATFNKVAESLVAKQQRKPSGGG